jgi:hypothetical protein
MKIVARIEKIGGEQYRLDGTVFDSFLSARREMTQRLRALRAERQTRKIGDVPLHKKEDSPPLRGRNREPSETSPVLAATQCG